MITRCEFGAMVIGDQTYGSDLIIYPDGRVADNWWRKSGHRLTLEDIQDLLAVRPEVIVAGTGIYGRMRVTSEVEKALTQLSIKLIALPTKAAAEQFNRIKQTSKNAAGCFHLTC